LRSHTQATRFELIENHAGFVEPTDEANERVGIEHKVKKGRESFVKELSLVPHNVKEGGGREVHRCQNKSDKKEASAHSKSFCGACENKRAGTTVAKIDLKGKYETHRRDFIPSASRRQAPF